MQYIGAERELVNSWIRCRIDYVLFQLADDKLEEQTLWGEECIKK
jgi:hypothetical protein